MIKRLESSMSCRLGRYTPLRGIWIDLLDPRTSTFSILAAALRFAHPSLELK